MGNPSFQIDDETLAEFDRIIEIKNVIGEHETSKQRSEVLRDLVREYIEGNEYSLNGSTPSLTTAD